MVHNPHVLKGKTTMDNCSHETRSYNMACIHSKDTKPELIVRKYLFNIGFRFRKNDKRYPGTPDIVLPKYKTCIFVNGCFWHHHTGCKYFVLPKTNTEFWEAKLNGNFARDEKNYTAILQQGWKVIVIWECQLKLNVRNQTLLNLRNQLLNDL